MSTVLESVTFRLAPGASSSAFSQASEATFAWVRQQPGFVHRVLSCSDDGQWSDHVHWSSMAEAMSASDRFMQSFCESPFMTMIDPATVQMQHTVVHMHS